MSSSLESIRQRLETATPVMTATWVQVAPLIANAVEDLAYLLAEVKRLREELDDWRMAAWWEHAFYNEKKDAVGHDFTADAEETEADMCTCGAGHWHTRGCKLGPQDHHKPALTEGAAAE